jgi:transcription initiation factor TFIIIB Brf1 subunit/transcription initiation factor TFIIB
MTGLIVNNLHQKLNIRLCDPTYKINSAKNMDAQHLKLFEQALKLVAKEFQETKMKRQDSIESDDSCKHDETSNDNGKKTCLECGELLEENYIATHHSSNIIGMKKRRKSESTIYNDIPFYIEQHIKDITIEIYQKATASKIFRNTSKRSIILASLHRASALAGNHISYYDLLDMFLLKQHEADKGFTILSRNIPKKSEFTLKFNQTKEEMISINSKLRKLGMDNKIMFNLVANTFNLVKEKSDIVNTSQPNSIICGCIYFWIVYTRIQKSDDEFSKTVNISKMTLLKVYVAVCDVVFNNILKAFFTILLKNCDPKPIEGPPKYKSTLKKSKNLLYGPTYRMLIHDPFDQNKIRVTPLPSKRDKVADVEDLPLEDVDNTQEWNVLLDQQYYSPKDVYMLHVKLIRKNDKEMYFDFTEYDKNNETDGVELLRSLLIKRFECDYELEDEEDENTELRSHLLLKRKLSLELADSTRSRHLPKSPQPLTIECGLT